MDGGLLGWGEGVKVVWRGDGVRIGQKEKGRATSGQILRRQEF